MMRYRFSAGFTLIETLVAIGVFTMAIVAPLTAASRALQAAGVARDTLIATNLAQEDLELARWSRSTAYLGNLSTTNLNVGLANCIAPKACDATYANEVNNAFMECTGGTCPPLLLNSTGFYNHTAGNTSQFRRSMTVVVGPNGQAGVSRATVTVTWNAHGAHSVQLFEDFYDWF